jgi:hypothetical protein
MKTENEKAPVGRPFKHMIGDTINGFKIVGMVEGDKYSRVFECSLCGNTFRAQITNIRFGFQWHCGCMEQLKEQAKELIVENFRY